MARLEGSGQSHLEELMRQHLKWEEERVLGEYLEMQCVHAVGKLVKSDSFIYKRV